ncbi:MAG: Error-prone repair protein ImuA [Bacteroidetes bacterium]|nr:Error-prone repair protein ImuA [Bacteroidota bacterium]
MLKRALFDQLNAEINRMQGFKPKGSAVAVPKLNTFCEAFPNSIFPTGAIHEMLSPTPETLAATTGFTLALLSTFLNKQSAVVWISTQRKVYAPALNSFGLQPDRILFVELPSERESLWAMEEALKSAALTAVVGEIQNISFTASRRLQLAVEQSQVTGFVLHSGKHVNTTACVSRWRVSSLPSSHVDELPGIGHPQWKVELLRMRNGKPGIWNLGWSKNELTLVPSIVTPEITGESLLQRAG